MLDRVIEAYRAKFFDKGLRKWLALIKSKRSAFIPFGIDILISIPLFITILLCYYNYIESLAVLIAAIFGLILVNVLCWSWMDRYIIKNNHSLMRDSKDYLKCVMEFLSSYEIDLCSVEQVDFLIDRLTLKEGTQTDVQRAKERIFSFCKAYAFPVLTFFVGIYAEDIKKDISFYVMLQLLIGGIIVIISVSWVLSLLKDGISSILNRNNIAASSLKEDLLDIKLLYLMGEREQPFISHPLRAHAHG